MALSVEVDDDEIRDLLHQQRLLARRGGDSGSTRRGSVLIEIGGVRGVALPGDTAEKKERFGGSSKRPGGLRRPNMSDRSDRSL